MEALLISGDRQGNELNSSRFRILTPAHYLAQAGHTIHLQNNPGWTRQLDGRLITLERGIDYGQIPEVVLIERNVLPEWVDKLRLAGARRIVVTFDDHYGRLQPWAAAKPWWEKHYSAFLRALGLVDLVIVPSQALADAHRAYCREIRYVPNYLDDRLYAAPAGDMPGRPCIGWGGSQQHIDSWQQKKLMRALARVQAENPEWDIRLFGEAIPPVAGLFPPGMRVTWSDWMPHDAWARTVAGFTIGIAPLHGEYDRYRSNLKLVEYGVSGVPWVASWLDPYSRGKVAGGVLVKEGDWYHALSQLVANAPARATLSEAGRRWADDYRMSRNVSVYEDLLWNGVPA